MKTNKLLSFFMLFCIFSICAVQGQNIRLTFAGTSNDLSVQPDSIRVYNLTQDIGPLTLTPGTILILKSGVEELNPGTSGEFSMELSGNHPVTDIGRFIVYVPEEDKVTIAATDMLGRRQVLYCDILVAGVHSFQFNTGSVRFMILSASWRSSTASLKIISSNRAEGIAPSISYNGINTERQQVTSVGATVTLPFNHGDHISFEGFIEGNITFIEESPRESHKIIFKSQPQQPPSTACPGIPTVTYAGKTYNTVQIGTQCWMKENLDVGVKVNSVYTPGVSHQETSNNGVIEKYCYENKTSNCTTFGGLYNWCEAVQYLNGADDWTLWSPDPYLTTSHIQGICPSGWHIPTEDEWETLTTALGGITGAGDKMKSTSTQAQIFWTGGVNGATNSSGFTGLPAGYRNYDGSFSYQHMKTYIWSATPIYSLAYPTLPQPALIFPRNRRLSYDSADLPLNGSTSTFGMSVRCVKD